MRLRPKQRKFASHMVESAGIEIARAFDYPNKAHLNRHVLALLLSVRVLLIGPQ